MPHEKKWYKSTYRLIQTPGGRFFGVIHLVRFNLEKGQHGLWYYTPAYPDRVTAKKRVKETLKDLANYYNALAKQFNGDLNIIDPDAWVWKPLE